MFEVLTEMLDPLGFITICGGIICYLLWEEKHHERQTTQRKEIQRCGRKTR
jgi:hypothetical protein